MNKQEELIAHSKYIIEWLKKQVKKSKTKGLIVGLSGGIDSALVAALAQQAMRDNFLALILPINNKTRNFDKLDAIEMCEKLNINYRVIDLENDYLNLVEKLKLTMDITKANLQARLRMSIIYAIAQENNYLVLGTDNKAEYELGYFTKYGDGACDLLPIINLYKDEVFYLAKYYNIPESILKKKPSAGLWEGQEDEKELGFSYNNFKNFSLNNKINSNIEKKIKNQILKTNHKRQSIPKPKNKKI